MTSEMTEGLSVAQSRTERCPYCGQPITREQFVEITVKVEREVANKARIELTHQRQQLEAQFDSRVSLEVAKRDKRRERDFSKLQRELAAGRKALDKDRRTIAARAALFEKQQQKAEADFRRREAKLEEDARRRASELARQEKERLEIAAQREKSAHEKERLAWDRKQNSLLKKIEDLNRRAAERTPLALQDYSEESLLSELTAAFKDQGDRIERLARGRQSGDIQQSVRYRDEEVGVIVYEVKNVKTWSNSFVDQAKRYRTIHNTEHVVLVSTTLPSKVRAVTMKDGILICEPEHAILMARVLREGIVKIAKAKLSTGEREAKVAQLYLYLNSDDYRGKAEGVVDGVRKLRELQSAERDAHQRTWQKQEQQHKRIDDDIGEVKSKVEAIIESDVPRVAVHHTKRKKRTSLAEEIATP